MIKPTKPGVSGEELRAARTEARPEVRTEALQIGEDADALWSVPEVGAFLKIPASSIYKLTARNSRAPIPHILIGGRLRFRRTDIERWLTLMSVSNLDVLERMRKKSSQVTHGNHSQAEVS